MKVRPAGRMMELEEAMQRVIEISNRDELLDYIRQTYAFLKPQDDEIMMAYYGYDERNGWDTHIVTVRRMAILFTDGPLPGFFVKPAEPMVPWHRSKVVREWLIIQAIMIAIGAVVFLWWLR